MPTPDVSGYGARGLMRRARRFERLLWVPRFCVGTAIATKKLNLGIWSEDFGERIEGSDRYAQQERRDDLLR
jgi:hypothetical protein